MCVSILLAENLLRIFISLTTPSLSLSHQLPKAFLGNALAREAGGELLSTKQKVGYLRKSVRLITLSQDN